MNTLLIYFAFPIAVIIISIVLQKLLNSPITVASLVFAIFLVITFAFFDETFLIATFVYTLLAYITAFIVNIIENSNENNINDSCIRGEDMTQTSINTIGLNTNSNYRSGYNRYRRFKNIK